MGRPVGRGGEGEEGGVEVMIYDKTVGAAVDRGCQLLELPLASKGVCVGLSG